MNMELTLNSAPKAPDTWLSFSPENLNKFGQGAMKAPRNLVEQRRSAAIPWPCAGLGER